MACRCACTNQGPGDKKSDLRSSYQGFRKKGQPNAMNIEQIETLACDAGWRNYHFLKLVTDDGIVGWSEFDEAFGPPGSRPSSRGMLTV